MSPSQRRRHRNNLRVNLGRMRGQALWRAGPVEVSVKHSAWATAALAVSGLVARRLRQQQQLGPVPAPPRQARRPASGSSAATTGKFLGCMVTDTGGIDDKSFNAASWAGMQAAQSATARSPSSSRSRRRRATTHPTSTRSSARSATSSSPSVSLMGDATKAAAKAHPSQKFAIVDTRHAERHRTSTSLVFNTAQDAFLGGYLAAGMTQDRQGRHVRRAGASRPSRSTWTASGTACSTTTSKHGKNVQVLGWNEKTQKRHLHRRLHRPDQGPDAHPDVHQRGRRHHLPGRRATSASARPRRSSTRTPRPAARR